MDTQYSPIASPSDFIIYNSYHYQGKVINGEFPVYIAGASLCCTDDEGKVTAIQIALPINE